MTRRTRERAAREQRLHALAASLEDRLAAGLAGRARIDEFIDHGEWGLALETMADEVGEYDSVLTPRERSEFVALAADTGIEESVRRRLGE